MIRVTKNIRGMTLIELMIAMAISLLVMAAIYQVFQSQQKASVTQQMVLEMQQNARAALSLMKREIRMAGYKPAASDGIDNNPPYNGTMDDADLLENGRTVGQEIGIMRALRDQIMFRMDLQPNDPTKCSDGVDDPPVAGLIDDPAECYDGLADDPGEQITYFLQPNAAGGNDLVRDDINGAGPSILAYDIEAIAFGYAYDADEDGMLDTDTGNPDGNVIWLYDSGGGMGILDRNAETGTAFFGPMLKTVSGDPLIGAVRIWLLARTPEPIRGEADTGTYQVGSTVLGPGTYDPRYRRTLQTATVYCRNLRF